MILIEPLRPLYIFGDSIIKGVMHTDEKYRLCDDHDFSSLLAFGFEPHNYAKMGATVRTGLAILERKLPSCAEGSVVLFSFGGNDCDYDWEQISAAPDAEHHPHLQPDAFLRIYQQLISTARARGAEVAVASIVPIDAQRYMRTISQNRSCENILKWLGDFYRLYRWQESYNALACTLARSLGCPVLDLRSPFLQSDRFPSLMSDDGIHPSPEGHALLHQTLAEVLSSLSR